MCKAGRITKSITLLSGTAEVGYNWNLSTMIAKKGTFYTKGSFSMRGKLSSERKRKAHMRITDRKWVQRNIPSSIVWRIEIHHDWENGGRMYLLTKGEHILRHRREK